ncbi:transglycosylase SLT domain-containing protein [Psychrobacter sp. AOP22-C1-22]|uniref:lytic transglycosylase domain-containing protein n=1 Tax=unclassified Psychrobacter TaxID=196806 RepID=UPI00178808CA|nr:MULTISPECIES: lytic transglycosylase domain-containing protein [unclassified Psychrobacter]MDN5801199.1 lytic transglycosylase domain-containing protein [Psychrobacter sp.]MBE0405995.1 lytic transglycosylase domain-containing protein [Psychrobacter sp. FME6]MBE0445198.1 lytic transglycosylase domain-containing protein [Psychrobacter sp. FME5]MDN5890709.1 lytic transglycosylase domain-containing protein [Psychrobacter sp.]MDN5897459.1 lytic transglycosylase domain-containing protein [Psychro
MTKLRVAHSTKDRKAIHQNDGSKRFKENRLRISVLSLATAVGTLGLSQVACADLTWGDNESYQTESYESGSYQQNTGYQSDNGASSFTAAAIAADRGDINALYEYEQAMSGGLFAMYPTYWRMNLDLNSQSSAAVSQFVRQYPDTVMAEKLVADFAEAKAGSNDYASVRQVANLITNADASERCAVALGFNNGGDTMRAMAAKSDVWLVTKKQPALCDQLAMEMNNNALISNQDRVSRLKRMLRKGKTGDIMALSSRLGASIPYSSLSETQLNPSSFFSRFSREPATQTNQYLYQYAIGRLAEKSYREAALQLDFDIKQDNQRASKLLNEDTRRAAYRTLGVQRMNHNTDDGFNAEAVDWFRKSLDDDFSFEEAEYYAIAAIRFSRWDDVVEAISQMDSEIQRENQWQYWLARAYEQSSDANKRNTAKKMYKNLAKSNEYYGLMAKDKVGQRFDASRLGGNNLPNVSNADRARVMQNPHFARAFALYNADASRAYANREWNWAVKKARDNRDDKLIVAAARQAHDMGWLDRAIYAVDNTDSVNHLAISHPMPHQSAVVRHSQSAGIDPAWAYGIMRQESRFVTSARSNVGASGLMQVMPATAKYIARNLGETYSASRANSGDTNIRYGTWYMGDIFGKLHSQPVLATAGYNAGPNNAKRWQPVYGSLAADQYVESFAFPETRNYVKHVMENATIYSSLLGRGQPISQRMGAVPAAF